MRCYHYRTDYKTNVLMDFAVFKIQFELCTVMLIYIITKVIVSGEALQFQTAER